jgi:hypothetical protein
MLFGWFDAPYGDLQGGSDGLQATTGKTRESGSPGWTSNFQCVHLPAMDEFNLSDIRMTRSKAQLFVDQ